MHHGRLFPPQLRQILAASRRRRALLQQLPPPRHSAAMLLALVGQLWKAGLEALEQRVGVFMLRDVGQKLVGEMGQGAMLDLGRRQLRAHEIGRRGPGHGEDAALHRRALELFVHFRHGRSVVDCRRLGVGAHQMRRRRRHLAAKGFQAASLGAVVTVSPVSPPPHDSGDCVLIKRTEMMDWSSSAPASSGKP